ncbi:MAG: hypothetical protein L0154_08810 [Chloroflexi bacterium]|nr:hypothetical protein [Chloroflexota bacterium]
MPDSPTFDNRYRYDYIYPRGRSGETLRAWDTQDHDRPVVIKRPAPQDAPPMRAAQEVSIKAERKALERLAGHPVLAELRGKGVFRVGGQSHEYIVVDRAEGVIIESEVLALDEQGERLPLLEVLVIIDSLLDLLTHAHEEQVVYNDVDAKHLFWNRDTYQLRVIDWGNAVLLDEGGGPSGVSRQTDIYQVGELLYFILTGGSRLDSMSTADGQYVVNFGTDAVRIPHNIQTIITRATHPNTRRRYTTIQQLREAVQEALEPLRKKRDAVLQEVEQALSRPQSRQELDNLTAKLDQAAEVDPAYPDTRRLQKQVILQRQRLALQADIDAARIYLDNGNWGRARDLMAELLEQADEVTRPLIEFIMDAATILAERGLNEPPHTLTPALDALLAGDALRAGHTLMAGQNPSDEQFLLADRMAALIPEVKLLRPPLVALENSSQVDAENIRAIRQQLDSPEHRGLQSLIDVYRDTISRLNQMRTELEATTEAEEYRTLLDPLGRAQTAAQAVMQHLEVVSMNAYGNPSKAGDALRAALAIDSLNPNIGELNAYFDDIHDAIRALASFTPNKDGSNLSDWFEETLSVLQPYGEDLDDRAFHQALTSIEKAARLWSETQDYLILGRRTQSIENLQQMTQFVEPFNQNLGGWMSSTVRQIQDATHVERLSPNEKLGQRLIEGYTLWDQGKYGAAVEHAESIADYAEFEGDKGALERLGRLGEIADVWLSTGGVSDAALTAHSDQDILNLLLPDEQVYLDKFIGDARGSDELYLKMMGRGLVDWMEQSSTAAPRILFLHYVWSGMQAAQTDDFEKANFWREAAIKTLNNARTNPIFAEFDNYLTGRQLVVEVQQTLNTVNSPQALLEARNLLNQPMADKWLGPIQGAVQQLQEGIQYWEDGQFQLARTAIEESLRRLRLAQENYRIDLRNLIGWVEPLATGSIQLQGRSKEIERLANTAKPGDDGTPEPADDILIENFREIMETTENLLGRENAYQMRQWYQIFEDIRRTHESNLNRNEKLIEFEAHFNNLFIDKHPAYPLFQVWRRTAQNLPEPIKPLPVTLGGSSDEVFVDDMKPESFEESVRTARSQKTTPAAESITYEDDYGSEVVYEEPVSNDLPWTAIIALGVVIVFVVIFIVVGGFGEPPQSDGDNSNNAVSNTTATDNADTATEVPPTTEPTVTPTVESATLPPPTDVPADTAIPPTVTPEPPTMTPEPATATLEQATPTEEVTQFVFGGPPQNILDLLNVNHPESCDWNDNWFTSGAGGVWQLGATQADAGSGPIVVTISPECLEALLGPQAAQRIRSMEVDFELSVFDANDVSTGQVFFGFGMQNLSRERTTAEIRVTQDDPIAASYGINQNGAFQFRTSLPNNPNGTMRLERQSNGILRLFVNNGQLLGDSETTYEAGAPLTPVLTTSGGDIFVVISRIAFELAPVGS